jgi:hypothetical protein
MISSVSKSTRTDGFNNPFSSFWMGGFECTDKLNAFGNRVDFLSLTGHLQLLKEDYHMLRQFHIKTVREGIRWSQVEKSPYQYDWSIVTQMIKEASAQNIQQIWDICHFGYPDDLTPLHPLFPRRFASVCREFAKVYRSLTDMPLIVTPINEVSFISWLGGEVRGTTPYCINNGWEVKYSLMRAYIEGVAALKETDPHVIILTTEPLVQIVPPLNPTADEIEEAALLHEEQYQAVDILTGNMCPELGGSPDYLDILGLNFYYNNQWIAGTKTFLPWANLDPDPRWLPMSELVGEAYLRYKKPVVLAETSHPGIDRPHWIQYITGECVTLLKQGIPFWGVCLYPIIDRPDWDHFAPWHTAGLWDARLTETGPPERVLCQPYAEAFRECQQLVDAALHQKKRLVVT